MTQTSKKTKSVRLVGALMAVCLIVTGVVFSSMALYTSNATGTDTVSVAHWSFDVEGTDIAESDIFNFDVFTTANFDEDGNDVVDGKIAPGTSGSFELNIKNTSEVSAEYEVDMVYNNDPTNPVPLQFRVDGGDWKTDINDLEAAMTAELEHTTGNTASHTIEWKWDFAGDHTAIGIAAPQVSISAQVTATQVN